MMDVNVYTPRVPEHQVIVNLSSDAIRTALERADSEGRSLSELIEALLRSEASAHERRRPVTDYPVTFDVISPNMPEILDPPTETRGRLPFLTNRLSPIKTATKALAELGAEGEWPALGDFQVHAAGVARSLGLRLRSEDRRAGRRGAGRRWTGYPVGDNAEAARGRFAASFTAYHRDGALWGPLAVLGLAATTNDGRIGLTHDGYELAGALSPLIDAGDRTLSSPEIDVFTRRLHVAVDETAAIGQFLGAVRHVAGGQSDLDALLATRNPDWSANRASAERAAMLGRLGELGMLRVEGRGSQAQIELMNTMGFEQGGEADERDVA